MYRKTEEDIREEKRKRLGSKGDRGTAHKREKVPIGFNFNTGRTRNKAGRAHHKRKHPVVKETGPSMARD